MTEELGRDNKRFLDVFQQMFPNISADENTDDVKLLTKAYHKYKEEYVKHIYFNPEGARLSK